MKKSTHSPVEKTGFPCNLKNVKIENPRLVKGGAEIIITDTVAI